MGNAVTDFKSVAKSLDDYAQRLGNIRSTMDSLGELKSFQKGIVSRVTAVGAAATAVRSSAICLEDVRIVYLTGEQRAQQKLRGKLTFKKGSIIGGVIVFPHRGRNHPPKWINPWSFLLQKDLRIGAALMLTTWPMIDWTKFNFLLEWIIRIVDDNDFKSKIGQTISSVDDRNSKYYWSNENMSYAGGFDGECTWYAYGRFSEKTGIKLNSARPAKCWLSENENDPRVSVSYDISAIKPNSIAVRTTGKDGHVMFIEHVTYDKDGKPAMIYFTESNADGNSQYDPGIDGVLKCLSYQDFISQKNPAGYITKKEGG